MNRTNEKNKLETPKKRIRTRAALLFALLALLLVSLLSVSLSSCDNGDGSSEESSSSDSQESQTGPGEEIEGIRWEISTSGVLTISGKGEMDAYKKFEDAPWASRANEIKTVSIGAEVEWVSILGFVGCKNLESFTVSENNINYAASANGLYSADFTTFYLYPAGARASEYSLLSGTKHIYDDAFSGNGYVEKVLLPASVLTIGKSTFAFCEKLKALVYDGNATEWETLSDGVILSDKVEVTLSTEGVGPGTSAISGLKADHSYEYLAISSEVTRGEQATLLMDGYTVFLEASNAMSYLEVTIPCEKAGIYGLTMKEYHGLGRLSYVTLVNRSVVYLSDITIGNRYTELSSDIPAASTLSSEDYAVPASVSTGEYTEYYVYTYLKAGLNRIRIAVRSGGKATDYDMGISSFRFDLISADTQNTETVFATDPAVIDDFKVGGQGVGRNYGGVGSFFRAEGSLDFNVNIKKEAIYDVYLISCGTLSSFSLTKNGEEIMSGGGITSGNGSTSLVPVRLGEARLSVGEQKLTFDFKASFLNFGAIRLVPQGEDPLASQQVQGFPEMTVGEGEIDLMPELAPLGDSMYDNGAFKLRPGVDNALEATVRIEKAGVYAIRVRGAFNGEYFLRNTTSDPASLFVVSNADASLGWQIANDGYGNYTVYQYFAKGNNTIQFWSDATATVEGMKMLPLSADAPTFVLLSTNTAGATASASKSYYWTKLMKDDTLTYDFRIAESGEYLLSGLVGGAAAKVKIIDAKGAVVKELVYDPASNADDSIGIMGNANAVIYAEMMKVTLSEGEYKIVVTGTVAAESHYSQLYLTKKGAAQTGMIWANIDFAPLVVPYPSDVKDAIDITETEVKNNSKSGIALNGSLLVYGGAANGVYFNVNASVAGFYQLEIAAEGRNMQKTYARLYNPAVTGELASTNRDPYLATTRNEAGYSAYGYYVYLEEGANKIYFEHDGDENGYYEIVAARLYKISDDNYVALLAPIKNTAVAFGGGGYIGQLRPSQHITYEFTATEDGYYKLGAFLSGTGKVNFRVYEGTGSEKKNIASAVSADGSFVSQFDEGLTFNAPDAAQAFPKLLYDGSSFTTGFTPDIGTVLLEKGKTYTFEIECATGTYLNVGAVTVARTDAQQSALLCTYPARSVGNLSSENLLSVPPFSDPDDVYKGEEEDKLVATPQINSGVTVVSFKAGQTFTGNGNSSLTIANGIVIPADATLAVTAVKSGIYKLVMSAYTAEDITFTASVNGVSSTVVFAKATGGSNSSDRTSYEIYVYLKAGKNEIALSGEGLSLYSVRLSGVEEVVSSIVHRNFVIGSVLPDNGRFPEGYYVLREGDSVGMKEPYVSVDTGFKWVSAFVGGEGYLTYTFKNIDNGEETRVTYDLTAALRGQSLGKMDLGYASFGYVKLAAGRYTVSVMLEKGSYALLTASFLAKEGHAHVYNIPKKAPSCTVDGATWNECFCGVIDSASYTPIPVDGKHEYGEWTVTEPTLTTEGSAARACIHCGHVETRTLPKKQSRYENVSVDVTTITLESSNKVLKFNCNVAKAGFYQIRMNTLLTPQAGKTNETYITAVSTAAPRYSSTSKSYLNDAKTAYEFSTGLSVYLNAGNNTVTLTAKGAFDAPVTEITLVNQSAEVDAWALSKIMNFNSNYPNNKKAEVKLTITEAGFYSVGYLMSNGSSKEVNVRFEKDGKEALSYDFSVNNIQDLLPNGITVATGTQDVTQYVEGEYIYLEAGEYTITVTPGSTSSFCFAGMTFALVD